MTRDLVVEKFAEGIEVKLVGKIVFLEFPAKKDAYRAYFLLKNAIELGIPVQIRPDRT